MAEERQVFDSNEEKKVDEEATSASSALLSAKQVDYNLEGYPKCQGPTSIKIVSYGEGDLHSKWQEMGMLVPHEALRFANQLIRDAILPLKPAISDTTSSSSNASSSSSTSSSSVTSSGANSSNSSASARERSSSSRQGLEWKLKVFKYWWFDWYLPCIEDHHQNEELIYFPAIKKRIAKLEKSDQMPPRLAADHKKIIEIAANICNILNGLDDDLDTLNDEKKSSRKTSLKSCSSSGKNKDVPQVEACASSATTSNNATTSNSATTANKAKSPNAEKSGVDYNVELEKLQIELKQFLDVLEEHIAEEEEVIPQLLKLAQMTREENDALIMEMIKHGGIKIQATFSPMVVYCCYAWMGASDTQKFVLDAIPAPLRYFINSVWMPKWRTHCLGNMVAIMNNERQKSVMKDGKRKKNAFFDDANWKVCTVL